MGAEGELTPGAVLERYVGAVVDTLVASGVDQVCLCPGSRSTPLALVIARHPAIRVWTHLDERSCAYFALGMAKASRRPVAILCSSGTAAVNFAPAVVEAYHARVPLIVLTADRPQELRETGANQTIEQRNLYGAATKWFVEMPLPETSEATLRYVRLVAARAVAASLGDAPGPVHLNFPFREPLLPDRRNPDAEAPAYGPSWDSVAPRSLPYMSSAAAGSMQQSGVLAEMIIYLLEDRPRGVIVCGAQDDESFPREVVALANLLRFPVLADPLSRVRCGSHYEPIVIGGYDNFLRDAACRERLRPDFVLRFGAAPTSKTLATLLERHGNVTLVTPTESWRDPELSATFVIQADASVFCRELVRAIKDFDPELAEGDPDPNLEAYVTAWQAVEASTRAAVEAALTSDGAVSEASAVLDLAVLLPDTATVFAGNSMPVRDVESFFPAGPQQVRFLANRGASGIDGVVSSALGASVVVEGRLVLLIGDLSFYHDMNGLLAAQRHSLNATIILINNDGGGIFSFLPQHEDAEHFELLFGTPHGLDFSQTAALYGLAFERADTREAYAAALQRSFSTNGVSVIEVRTDREENLALHHRLWREVADAVRAGAP